LLAVFEYLILSNSTVTSCYKVEIIGRYSLFVEEYQKKLYSLVNIFFRYLSVETVLF